MHSHSNFPGDLVVGNKLVNNLQTLYLINGYYHVIMLKGLAGPNCKGGRGGEIIKGQMAHCRENVIRRL